MPTHHFNLHNTPSPRASPQHVLHHPTRNTIPPPKMADIKATKDAIWRKKQQIQKEQGTREEWTTMVPSIQAEIGALPAGDPTLDVWKESLDEAQKSIAMQDKILAKLNGELAALEAELPATAEPAAPKFDPEKHPLLRKAVENKETEQVVNFSTGDMVEAQWSDRSWYKAKIQSVLGSASAPKYVVRFVEYDDTMTVDRTAVRPLASKRKRDPDPVAAPYAALPATSNPHVISGPASINPNVQIAKNKAAADDDEEPKKKSRIANKGQLKKRQGAWNDFLNKSGKKIPKKESMFRTSTEAGSRVGFTGSGKGMTETHKRTRYNHKADAERDEEYSEAVAQSSSRKRY